MEKKIGRKRTRSETKSAEPTDHSETSDKQHTEKSDKSTKETKIKKSVLRKKQ